MIHIEIEGKNSIEAIQKKFKDQLSEKEIRKTTGFALNKTAEKVSGMIAKNLKDEYTITPKYKKRLSKLTKPAGITSDKLYAEVSYDYGTIPMVGFKHRDNNKGKKRTEGVSVEIKKGKNQILKHAFVATMASGHTGIFATGRYNGGKFIHEKLKTSNNKTKITEMKTASPFTMATNKVVKKQLETKIEEQLPKRVQAMLQQKVNKLTK